MGITICWRWKLEAQTKGYDAAKGLIHFARNVQTGNFGIGGPPNPMNGVKLLGEVADWALREGEAPLSKPTQESLYWALEGITDGLEDYKNNPDLDHNPEWFRKLLNG